MCNECCCCKCGKQRTKDDTYHYLEYSKDISKFIMENYSLNVDVEQSVKDAIIIFNKRSPADVEWMVRYYYKNLSDDFIKQEICS